MRNTFHDRSEAGKLLAEELKQYANRTDVLVLGLPRGGVPVAYEVARTLHAPLDVFVVRKLGLPESPELAMGAIASGGIRVLNDAVVQGLQISNAIIDAVAAREGKELRRREIAYRGHNVPSEIRGKTVILVDDGIATGSTMEAAVRGLKQQGLARLVVAVPTAAAESAQQLGREVDEFVALLTPEIFYAVGEWYEDFSQTSDEDVSKLLEQSRQFALVE